MPDVDHTARAENEPGNNELSEEAQSAARPQGLRVETNGDGAHGEQRLVIDGGGTDNVEEAGCGGRHAPLRCGAEDRGELTSGGGCDDGYGCDGASSDHYATNGHADDESE